VLLLTTDGLQKALLSCGGKPKNRYSVRLCKMIRIVLGKMLMTTILQRETKRWSQCSLISCRASVGDWPLPNLREWTDRESARSASNQ